MTARVLLGALLAPATALAHPGHGETAPDGWLHYLTEPAHVMLLVALGSVAVVGVRWRGARKSRPPRDG